MSVLAFFSVLIVISLGTVGLITAAGAGLAVASTLMCWPPARRLIPGKRTQSRPASSRPGG